MTSWRFLSKTYPEQGHPLYVLVEVDAVNKHPECFEVFYEGNGEWKLVDCDGYLGSKLKVIAWRYK